MQNQQPFEFPTQMMYSSQPGQIIFPDQVHAQYPHQPIPQQQLQHQHQLQQQHLQQYPSSQPMLHQHQHQHQPMAYGMPSSTVQVQPWAEQLRGSPSASSEGSSPPGPDHHISPPPPLLMKEENYSALLDDEDDDDLNIDTSNMTQEEKNDIKHQRKLRKMNREKLKRSKLNNQFEHLCQMLSMGRSTRVEKLTVLNEAIRTVCQLKAENEGLRMQKQRIKLELDRRRAGSGPQPPLQRLQQLQQPPLKVESYNGFSAYSQFPQHPQAKQEPGLHHHHHHPGMKFGWQQQAPPPPQEDNDLDFAFGDSSDNFWEAEEEQEPWHQQWPTQAPGFENLLDTKGFPACAQPLDTDDSVDMFLDNGGDSSDLLCF